MDDLISRQAAINAPVRMVSEGIEWIPVYHVEQLPSAQPHALIDQLRWERDVAVRQLHDLVYEFGEAVKDAQPQHEVRFSDEDHVWIDGKQYISLKRFGEAVKDAQPQRIKGRWIDVTKTGGAELWKCSECGELELEDSYYCPNCGADMRGDEDAVD